MSDEQAPAQPALKYFKIVCTESVERTYIIQADNQYAADEKFIYMPIAEAKKLLVDEDCSHFVIDCIEEMYDKEAQEILASVKAAMWDK